MDAATEQGGRAARRGMTLVELLMVIVVLALVLGIGLGAFAQVNPAERAALGLTQSLLRAAQQTAVQRGAPARVWLDHPTRSLRGEALAVVGTWHFEQEREPFAGAFGLEAVFDGDGRSVEDGYHGRGISFVGAGSGSGLEARVQLDPAWDLEQGFLVELCARPVESGDARLLAIGDAFELHAGAGGSLEAVLARKLVDELGVARRGPLVRLRSAPGALRAGRWSRLRVGYDRRWLRIEVEGVEVARVAEEAPVWSIEGPLVLGGGRRPFQGVLDALVVAVVSGEETLTLPGGVRFAPEAPRLVGFAAGGALDRDLHRGPVAIELEYRDGRRESVLVGVYGTVQ